ncbi:MAG: tetratricopeptide repeat-containing sensor histidine kinase [Reichenbachiella sp.]
MIKKLIQILFLTIFISKIVYGQVNTDSLRQVLENAKNDTSKIRALNNLIFELSYGEKSEAIELLKESIQLSKKSNYEYGLAEAYSLYGQIHVDKGNHDSAQYYYLEALNYFESQQLPEQQSNCYKKLAQIHQERNSFDQSLIYIKKLLAIAEETQDPKMLGNAHNGYAAFYINQGWNMVDNLNDTIEFKKFFKQAKPHIYTAIGHFKKANYEKGIALAYGNLCILNREMGLVEEALSNIKKANQYFTKMNQEMYMASAYNHINVIFQKMEMFDSALYYTAKSLALAEKLESKFDIRNAYGQFSYIYIHLEDYKNALEYNQLYNDINSELLAENKQAVIDEMEVKYEAEKKEKELNLKAEENKRQQQFLIFLSLGFFILVVALVIIWRKNKLEHSLNSLLQHKTQELESMNQEISQQRDQLKENNELIVQQNANLSDAYQDQNNIMAVVAHDLRSPLNNLKGLNQLMHISGPLNEEQTDLAGKTTQVIDHGLEIINDMMNHHQIQNESEMDFSIYKASLLMAELLDSHQPNASRKKTTLKLQEDADDFEIETNKLSFMRIMDNLISNAIKFSPQESQIRISYITSNELAIFSIKDQGPGFSNADLKSLYKRFQKLSAKPTGSEKSSGLGLSIVKTLIDKLNGKIELETILNEGSTFKISLPIKPSKLNTKS